jgi:hypothetical protein
MVGWGSQLVAERIMRVEGGSPDRSVRSWVDPADAFSRAISGSAIPSPLQKLEAPVRFETRGRL